MRIEELEVIIQELKEMNGRNNTVLIWDGKCAGVTHKIQVLKGAQGELVLMPSKCMVEGEGKCSTCRTDK
jgi:ferredoxin